MSTYLQNFFRTHKEYFRCLLGILISPFCTVCCVVPMLCAALSVRDCFLSVRHSARHIDFAVLCCARGMLPQMFYTRVFAVRCGARRVSLLFFAEFGKLTCCEQCYLCFLVQLLYGFGSLSSVVLRLFTFHSTLLYAT